MQTVVLTASWMPSYPSETHRKNPWRLSAPRKNRVRLRLKAVDDVVSAVSGSGVQTRSLTRVMDELPREDEMEPRDKYTTYTSKRLKEFSRTSRDFRKSVHKVGLVQCGGLALEGAIAVTESFGPRLILEQLLPFRTRRSQSGLV